MTSVNKAKQLVAESDWLASDPVFYDLSRGLVCSKFQDATPALGSPSFHPEGLYNYFDFGYSVFEQTPIRNVRFIRHSSRIWRDERGALEIEYLQDPFDQYVDWRISEADIIDLIRERVQAWEASLPTDQEIVLPLSGGFDSRLLLWCLRNPSRVRAFTYGISGNQSRSIEVVHAQALADRFGLRWERISLGDFHLFLDEWDAEFGLSAHAHGMYHFEFYSKIRERLKGKHALLSGIFGDVWAGSISPQSIDKQEQLVGLGYTHGLRGDPERLLLPVQHALREKFWKVHHGRLKDHRFQVATTIRLKIMLISYLMRVPRLFNFEPWSPYLDIDIAMAMLNLPQERRRNRKWQREFFAKVGLDLENQGMKGSRSNSLNFQALKRMPLRQLNRNLLSALVDPAYVDWINKNVLINPIVDLYNRFCLISKIGGALRRVRLYPSTMEAYCAYLCIKPVENFLLKNQN